MCRAAWQGALGLLAIHADAMKLRLISGDNVKHVCGLAETLLHWTRSAVADQLDNDALTGSLLWPLNPKMMCSRLGTSDPGGCHAYLAMSVLKHSLTVLHVLELLQVSGWLACHVGWEHAEMLSHRRLGARAAMASYHQPDALSSMQ